MVWYGMVWYSHKIQDTRYKISRNYENIKCINVLPYYSINVLILLLKKYNQTYI